ncbi:MAG: threonine/serine exporter [Eubacterium sp.]|jgi:uncharacterized membrane protein YjjB (DUF3815 family)|nr:threonine/serine exporter [Eubacterium sp.]
MAESIKLILLSFLASVGFGVKFQMKNQYLVLAGFGGALTRLCYLLLIEVIDSRLIYSLLAAMFASLYAEVMAMKCKMPSTVFLYPAIIPLTPGNLIYNTAANFLLKDTRAMWATAGDCALTLLGISIGFVLISTFTYYRRVYFLGKDLASHLLHHPHKKQD